jgi:hypothetical protein
VARTPFTPATPDQRARELQRSFRDFDREEPGPERAARLATFTRAAHQERQLNMAMHTAQLCLAEDPEQPALLVAAYLGDDGDDEEQLRSVSDLRDLGRYLDRADIVTLADSELGERARTWVTDGDEQQRRHRLRTLSSLVSRAFADTIRDELELGH